MAEEGKQAPPEPRQSLNQAEASSSSPPPFDPSRTSLTRLDAVIGIIKRKALIKELAAAYHTECLALCRELLELQKKKDEPFIETIAPENQPLRPSKRAKKLR